MKVDIAARLFLEYGGATFFKGISALVGLVLSLALTRLVGASVAGYYFLFLSIVTVASVVCRLGGDNYLLKTVPHLIATEDFSKLVEATKYAVYVSFCVSVMFSISMMFLGAHLLEGSASNSGIRTIIHFAACTLPFYSVLITCSFFLLATRKAVLSIGLPGIALPILFILGLLVAVMSGTVSQESVETNDIRSILSVYFLSALFIAIVSIVLVIRHIIHAVPAFQGVRKFIVPGISAIRDGLQASMPFFVVSMLGVLNLNIGNLAAGYFLEPRDVAYLAISTKIATSIALILTAVNAVSAPKFSGLYRAGELESLQQVFRDTRAVTVIVGVVPFLLILLFSREILSIFGPEFESAAAVLVIIAIGQFFNSATGPVTYLLQMTGNEHLFMNISIATSLMAVVATVVLTSAYGVIGAATASALSLIVLNSTALVIARKRLGISWK